MDSDSHAIANDLNDWFHSVQRRTAGLFSLGSDQAHRDAVVLDVLRRNARIVYEASLDNEGRLYSPICFFLAAACQQLRTSLGIGHWRASLDNLRDLQRQLADAPSDVVDVGLEMGSPSTFFKGEFDEAIRQSGLIDGTSFLSKQDRQVALGLAVNWGIRLLLAYAVETARPTAPSQRQDLAWLAERVRSSIATVPD
jgi:hypothetical protein